MAVDEAVSSVRRRWFSQPDEVSSDGRTLIPCERANRTSVRSSRLPICPQASMVTHWAATSSIPSGCAASEAQEVGSYGT
jgi:hypothetical protein